MVVSVSLMILLSSWGAKGVAVGFTLGLVFQYCQLLFNVRVSLPDFRFLKMLQESKEIYLCSLIAAIALYFFDEVAFVTANRLGYLLIKSTFVLVIFAPLFFLKKVKLHLIAIFK